MARPVLRFLEIDERLGLVDENKPEIIQKNFFPDRPFWLALHWKP